MARHETRMECVGTVFTGTRGIGEERGIHDIPPFHPTTITLATSRRQDHDGTDEIVLDSGATARLAPVVPPSLS